MTKKIDAHGQAIRKAHAHVCVLGFSEGDVDALRGKKHPKVEPVVKRFDELHAAATAEVEKAGKMPYPEHVKSLVVEPVGGCP